MTSIYEQGGKLILDKTLFNEDNYPNQRFLKYQKPKDSKNQVQYNKSKNNLDRFGGEMLNYK